MGPVLADIVERAYALFPSAPPTPPLSVCSGCCMPLPEQDAITSVPRRRVPADPLRAWAGAAWAPKDEGVIREMRYFLPRIMQLLAEGDPIHGAGREALLTRLAPEVDLSDAERALLQEFAHALLKATLARPVEQVLEGEPPDAFTEQFLIMFVRGGLPIRPLLTTWECCFDPAAALETAYARWAAGPRDGANVIWLEDRPSDHATYIEWLHGDELLVRQAAALERYAPGRSAVARMARELSERD